MSKIVESFLTALGSDLSDAQRAIRRYGIGSRSSAPRHVAAAFNPLSLSPSLWLRSDRGLITDGAAQFTAASSQSLSVASNSSLQTGDVDFWFATWVYFDTSSAQVFAAKGTAGNQEWALQYSVPANRFRFNTISHALDADDFGAASTGTWYFVLIWHDATNDTKGIRINNGTANTATGVTAPTAGTDAFQLGTHGALANYLDGRLDSVMFGKSPPGGIASVISAISSSLYNSGAGKSYEDLSASEKTDWGLISAYDFRSPSGGLVVDSHGSNTLTNNNTVTFAAGKSSGLAVNDGDPITTWQDQSGNARHMAPTGASRRPTLKLAIKNGKPVIRFDGVDDWMVSSAAASVWRHLHDGTGSTVFVVLNQTVDAAISVLETGAWSSTERGWLLYRENALDRLAVYIDNGAGNILSLNGSTNSWIHNQWKILETSYEDNPSVTDAFLYVNGSSVGSADDTGSPSASDPQTTLYLGTRNTITGTALLTGDVAEILIFPSVLDSDQRSQVRDYLNTKYAVY